MESRDRFKGKTPYRDFQEKKEVLTKPLSQVYANKKEIFLENGKAYELSQQMRDIPPHQLRKILNSIKNVTLKVKKDPSSFTIARDELYYVVPLTAYNAGRNKNIKPLYTFVQTHITEQTIQSVADIKVLDELFTSIIAYHKLKNSK